MRLLAALLCVGLSLSAAGEEAPLTAATQLANDPAPPPADAFVLDETHLLKPAEGLGWLLVDQRSGEAKHLILPAFHPHHSRPALVGDKLAYVSFTKKGEQFQLGCITFDLSSGKVLNRRDTDLTVVAEDEAPGSIRIGDGGQHASCMLSGEHCSGHGKSACTRASEDVTLSFVALEEARKGLKGTKSRKSKRHKGGKSVHGKTAHGAQSARKTSHRSPRPAPRKVHQP